MNETASTAGSGGVTLPSWAAHLEQKLAPGPLLLVQAFVDTLDLDLGTDILAQPDQARAWLDAERVVLVAVTAHAVVGARYECVQAGMDDYIAKPIQEGDLKRALEKWCP